VLVRIQSWAQKNPFDAIKRVFCFITKYQ